MVRGTRIAVSLVLEELAQNPDIAELLAAHPDLTRRDVQACLAYAKAMVTGEEVSPKPPKGARTDAPPGRRENRVRYERLWSGFIRTCLRS